MDVRDTPNSRIPPHPPHCDGGEQESVRPKVYVLILTYNRLHKLRHLIDNPAFWHGFDHLYVMSQASEDGTDEWLAEYAAANPDKPMTIWTTWQNLMAIGGRQRMLDRLLMMGMQRDDIIVMLDDDMMPVSPKWCERLIAPMLTPPDGEEKLIGACGVGGHNVRWGGGLFRNALPNVFCDIVNSGWTAYRGAVFLDGVEFDQQYLPFWHADSDLAMQIREKGYSVYCTGPIGMAHAPHHREMDALWRARRDLFIQKWRGKGLTRMEQERGKKMRALAAKMGSVPEPEAVVSVYAPDYNPYSGYGRMALELVYRLSEKNVYVNPMGTPSTPVMEPGQSDAIQDLLERPIRMTFGGILLGYPTLHQYYGVQATEGPTVAVTMFESTKLPPDWANALNRCDAVVVPSEFLVKIFKRNGVTPPIHVVPLGVSETFLNPPTNGHKPRSHRIKNPPSDKDPFTFICWGDRGDRKGWDVAMQAFHKAFGDRRDVRLIVKAREDSFPFEVSAAHPNIDVLRGDLDEAQLRDLYLRVDCMVFPARGEGFGLPPREFAATGGPALVTEWWADDVQQWGYPVHYKLKKAWSGHPHFDGLGKWAEPDLDHLAKQMQQVVNQDPQIIQYMGQRSATRVRKLYTWDRFVEGIWQVWLEAQKRFEKRQKRRKSEHVSNGK